MSCVQTDNFLADVSESFTNESQINLLIIMRHLRARKQNVEGNSAFLICDASVPGYTDWLHCRHGINTNIATQLSPGGYITRRDTQSMKLAHTSLNTLNYTIQQYSSSFEKIPRVRCVKHQCTRKHFINGDRYFVVLPFEINMKFLLETAKVGSDRGTVT